MDSQPIEANVNGESREAERLNLDHTDDDGGEEDESYKSQPMTGDGASPGKIFIGGLARETTSAQFIKHFGKYGEIIDSVIMKDRKTGQPRGFGFVTYADPSVVDKVIQDSHIINGKQVEIKRTIPRGASGSKDFKTRKIFVGGIPTTMNEDEFKEFFSQYGVVKEHQIMRDHATSRSRGFGFVTFETEQAVDDLLSKGTKIEMLGSQVEIKKAEPKKPNAMPAPSSRYNSSRSTFGYADNYEDYSSGYRLNGPYGGRHGGAGGYGGPIRGYDEYPGNDFGGGYGGGYGPGVTGGGFGSYRGEPPVGYSGRYGGGAYGGRPYDMGGYGGTGHSYGGGYGGGGGAAGGSGGAGYGGSYDAGLGGGYGGGGAGGGGGSFYGGGRGGGGGGGYGGGAGNGRYHPYGR